MNITTRLMEPGEAHEVRAIGKRSFGGVEGFFITAPESAIVAVKDGKIVGAVQYKFYRIGKQKIGYFDYAFIHPDCHNQGIGSILYHAAADFLWEQGCDALTASVKDDNVGSWSLLQKNGFVRISVPELARQFGVFGMLRLYFGTIFNIAVGMDYYVALKDRECPSGKGGNLQQITAYLMSNMLLSLLMIFRRPGDIGAFFAAYGIFLVGGILTGYAGTLFSKRRWHFRLCNGGGLVCAFINLIGGVYPMAGNWYPDHYENTDGFRREMGLNALSGWLFVLILALLPMLAPARLILFRYLGQMGSIFLLYRVLAFYPFESFGGGRVYRWNKIVFFLMAALSLAVYALNNIG